MTDRLVHRDGLVPASAVRVEPAAYFDRSPLLFDPSTTPVPPPEVSRVLIQRVVPDSDADGRERGSVAPDPVAQRVAELTAGGRPVFDIPAARLPAGVCAAAACPDLFLLDVPPASQFAAAADLVTATVGLGQRVLVVTTRPDDLIARVPHLADRLGRAVGAGEGGDLPFGSAGRTAAALAAGERAVRCDRLRERLAAAEHADRLAAEEGEVKAEFDRLTERIAAEVEATEAYRGLTAERAANEARWLDHQQNRSAAERELADLRAHPHPAGGFLKRLFGGGKNCEADAARIAALEARLRELDTASPPEPDVAFRNGRDRLIAARRLELTVELDGRLDRLRASRNGTCEPVNQLREELAALDARPPAPSTEAKDSVRVVVAPPAAVGFDPFLTASHPEAAPRFDRLVWVAESGEDQFRDATRLAGSWVLVGTPGQNESYFADLWAALDDSPWAVEGDRTLARLTPVPSDRRPHLVREPLIDRAEIELRYLDGDAGRELVEIRFPLAMTAAEARAFVAAELGEVRIASLGPAVWHETADAVTCCWPAVEADPTATPCAVDLGDGVTEQVCRHLTASVRFATAAGWTRESAADWLAARCHTSARTAVLR